MRNSSSCSSSTTSGAGERGPAERQGAPGHHRGGRGPPHPVSARAAPAEAARPSGSRLLRSPHPEARLRPDRPVRGCQRPPAGGGVLLTLPAPAAAPAGFRWAALPFSASWGAVLCAVCLAARRRRRARVCAGLVGAGWRAWASQSTFFLKGSGFRSPRWSLWVSTRR